MDEKLVSKSRLSMSGRRSERRMKSEKGDNSPAFIRTPIPESNDTKSTPPSKGTKPPYKDECKGKTDVSLFPSTLFPNRICTFEKELKELARKNEKDDSKDSSFVAIQRVNYIPYIPSYLYTDNKNEGTAAVTPSPKHKVTKKRVLCKEKVEHINNDNALKTSKKKRKTTTQESPNHNIMRASTDRAWSYDYDDVSYSSDS